MSEDQPYITDAELEALNNAKQKGLGCRVIDTTKDGIGGGIMGAIKGGLAGVATAGGVGFLGGAGAVVVAAVVTATPIGLGIAAAAGLCGVLAGTGTAITLGPAFAGAGAAIGAAWDGIKGMFGANDQISKENEQNAQLTQAIQQQVEARQFNQYQQQAVQQMSPEMQALAAQMGQEIQGQGNYDMEGPPANGAGRVAQRG